MNKKTLLITSGIIALSLLNVSSVHAEINDNLEATEIEKDSIHNSTEESLINLPIDAEEDVTKIIDKNSNDNQDEFNEIVEKLRELLNDEQKEILDDILSEENATNLLFKEAIIAHEFNKFEQESERYNEILIHLSDEASKDNEPVINFIELFREISLEKIELLTYDYSKNDISKAPIEDESKSESDDKTPSEIEDEIEIEVDDENLLEPEDEFQTESDDTNLIIDETEKNVSNKISSQQDQLTVKKSKKTAAEYYEDVKGSSNVSDMWKLAQESKTLFSSSDAYVVEAINYAAEKTLNYAIKQHQRGNYHASLTYYNRIINEELVKISIQNLANNYYILANNQK